MSTACPTSAAAIAEEQSLHLEAGEVHTIAEPGAMIIRCAAGAAWVTQAGMSQDVVLEAGMSFRPRAAGKVVIQGLLGVAGISLEHADGD